MDAKVVGTICSGDSSKKYRRQLVLCTPAKDSGLCLQEREPVCIQPDQLGGRFLPGGECWEERGREVSLLRGKAVGTEGMSYFSPTMVTCVLGAVIGEEYQHQSRVFSS